MQKPLLTTSRPVPSQPLSNGNFGKTTPHHHLPSFIPEHGVFWYEISLSSVGVICLCCVLSQLLVHP